MGVVKNQQSQSNLTENYWEGKKRCLRGRHGRAPNKAIRSGITPYFFCHLSSCTASESPRSRISVHHPWFSAYHCVVSLSPGFKVNLRLPVEFTPDFRRIQEVTPVGAPGGPEHKFSGIAVCPTQPRRHRQSPQRSAPRRFRYCRSHLSSPSE